MKNILVYLIAMFSIVSCSSDKVKTDDDKIVGYWVDFESGKYPSLDIRSNGKFELKYADNDPEGTASGTYSLTNNNLVLKDSRGNFKYVVTWMSDDHISLYGGFDTPSQPKVTLNLKRK